MSHREKEKTEVYYIQSNESHGGTVGAQSNGGYLTVLFEILCPKHLPQRMSRICKLQLCRSLCHWHLPDIALFSFHSVPPCALLCKSFRLSLYISEEPFFFSCAAMDASVQESKIHYRLYLKRNIRPLKPCQRRDTILIINFLSLLSL